MCGSILIRELRVWRKCPEIRSTVARSMMWRVAFLLLVIPTVILALPFSGLSLLTDWAAPKLDAIAKMIGIPASWLVRRRRQEIEKSHEILPLSEIRKRVGKNDPKTSPKTN